MEVPVKGKSMEPYIFEGDILKVKPKRFYFFGDILLFFNDYKQIMCHRFIWFKIKNKKVYFCLKGDNNKQKEIVPKENVIGKVVEIKRNGNVIKVSNFENFKITFKVLWNLLKKKIKIL